MTSSPIKVGQEVEPRATAWRFMRQAAQAGTLDDGALDRVLGRPEVEPAARALTIHLLRGTLRYRRRLDALLAQVAREPLDRMHPGLLDALRLATYQLDQLDSIPPYAIVDETVRLVRRRIGPWAGKVANGILRTLVSRLPELALPDPTVDPIGAMTITESFPDWLVARWVARLGQARALALCRALNRPLAPTLRVNVRRADPGELVERLAAEGVVVRRTERAATGLRLVSGDVRSTTAWRRGELSVQGEASQLVGALLPCEVEGDRIDLCAGAGGKALHWQERGAGRLLCFDRHGGRLRVLGARARRLGLEGLSAVQADLLALPLASLATAGALLLDAPCSSLGALARHPDAKGQSPRRLRKRARLQRRALKRLLSELRPGAELVYAVCSLEPEEFEAHIRWAAQLWPDVEVLDVEGRLPPAARDAWNAEGRFLRLSPERHGTEGMSALVWRRRRPQWVVSGMAARRKA